MAVRGSASSASISRHPVAAALLIGAATGFLLCGYEFARSVSSSLYIGAYGARRLPVVMALSPLGTLALIYGYGRLLSHLRARRTLFVTSLLSGLGFLMCYVAVLAGSRVALGVLYVLREGYIVLIIEQYWSFINSTLLPDQAKKVNGPVCGIASLGGISGGLMVGRLAQTMGSEHLLVFAAFSLVPAALLAWWAYGLGGEPSRPDAPQKGALALGLFRENRTLVYLALLVAVTQAVASSLELRFNGLVELAQPMKDARTAYLGHFYATLNGAAFVCQFVLAPLALRFAPLRGIHMGIPTVHLLMGAMLLMHPSLAAGAAAFLTFKALDYSVFRAGKEILYIPLSFDARYRAKEVIDAFIYRGSKGVLSGAFALADAVFGRLAGFVYPTVVLVMTGAWGWLGGALTGRRREGSDRARAGVEYSS